MKKQWINICSPAVKEYKQKEAYRYYECNYELLVGQTTNFPDEVYLGKKEEKVCRFCGKSELEVKFDDKPHVFPICTGNENLLSYYECDTCNHFFGDYLEGEYQNFFSFLHNLYKVRGRKGKIPLVQSNDNSSKMTVIHKNNEELIHFIREIGGKEHTKFEGNIVTLSSPDITVIPIAIYKCLTKMALSIMPDEEVINFKKTIDWIKEKKHRPIMGKKHMCRYLEFMDSPYVKYPMGFLFRRKSNCKDGPYMIFQFVYAKMMLMLEVPCDNVQYNYDIRKTLPLAVGNPIEDLIIDFSKTEKCFVKGWQRSFNCGYIENLAEEVRNPNTENEYAKIIRNKLHYS